MKNIMKIAIDIKSALGEKTGKGVYAWNIVKEMVESGDGSNDKSKKHEFLLYSPDVEDPFLDELGKRKNVEIVKISEGGLKWHFRVFEEVASKYKNGKLDAYFSPSSFIVAAMFYAVKMIGGGPKVFITIHDLVAFLYSATHNKRSVFIEKMTLKWALKAANGVFAVSENTANDVALKFGIPREKIVITHNAVGEVFLENGASKKIGSGTDVKKKYNLPKKYILSLGTLVPRKNLPFTLRVFEELCKGKNGSEKGDLFEHELVIVGGKGWGGTSDEVLKIASENEKVHHLGYVPHEDLPAIYAGADLFLYPSLYEGFGIPPLEAMACGTPVIVSNMSSLPEVVGSAAIQIDPTNEQEMQDAILGLLKDEKKRQSLIKLGHERVKNFSWEKSAKTILDTMAS